MRHSFDDTCEISIVVPVFNEAGNITTLLDEIVTALNGESYELIVVNDNSTDGSFAVLQNLQNKISQLRILSHTNNAGQSRAIRTGALFARGNVLCLLDGDGQNVPADFPKLIARLRRSDAPKRLAMIGGVRQKRQDTISKRWASKLANWVRGGILGDGTTDTGCGIKVIKRDVFLRLPFFDHQHRYMPALVLREGYEVEFLPVQHRERLTGSSKYSNFGRLLVSFRDLLGVKWLQARSRLPGDISED
ncbi:MAG: glycosyltransferase family 2 protein [Robiginitomaculum sp.]|nr:glycosyltransferase family 2 protein [Robiginitomaculum sp.]